MSAKQSNELIKRLLVEEIKGHLRGIYASRQDRRRKLAEIENIEITFKANSEGALEALRALYEIDSLRAKELSAEYDKARIS